MGLDAAIGLLVAISDLKAVRAVTRAINANLPKDGPLGTIRPSSAQLYARPKRYYSQTPDLRVLPRPVERPTPTYATKADTYDRFGCGYRNPPIASGFDDGNWVMAGPTPRSAIGPFEAPWKTLPAVIRPVVEMKVNVIRPKVDVLTKGVLLDRFA